MILAILYSVKNTPERRKIIQQNPRPDSPTYFLLARLQIKKVINQKCSELSSSVMVGRGKSCVDPTATLVCMSYIKKNEVQNLDKTIKLKNV